MAELEVNVPSVSARLLEKATVELQSSNATTPKIVLRVCTELFFKPEPAMAI
jgi:hypothetical protein